MNPIRWINEWLEKGVDTELVHLEAQIARVQRYESYEQYNLKKAAKASEKSS